MPAEPQHEIFGAVKVKDGLFLGDQYASCDTEFLAANKVTRIINCATSQVASHFEDSFCLPNEGIRYLNFDFRPLDEYPKQDVVILDSRDEVANKVYDFIEEAMEQGESCLIHSFKGRSRACCLVLAYIIKKYQWTLCKAVEFLLSRRPDVLLPQHCYQQLVALEASTLKLHTQLSHDWTATDVKSEELIIRNTYVNSMMAPIKQSVQGDCSNMTDQQSTANSSEERLQWRDTHSDYRSQLEEPASIYAQRKDLVKPILKNISRIKSIQPSLKASQPTFNGSASSSTHHLPPSKSSSQTSSYTTANASSRDIASKLSLSTVSRPHTLAPITPPAAVATQSFSVPVSNNFLSPASSSTSSLSFPLSQVATSASSLTSATTACKSQSPSLRSHNVFEAWENTTISSPSSPAFNSPPHQQKMLTHVSSISQSSSTAAGFENQTLSRHPSYPQTSSYSLASTVSDSLCFPESVPAPAPTQNCRPRTPAQSSPTAPESRPSSAPLSDSSYSVRAQAFAWGDDFLAPRLATPVPVSVASHTIAHSDSHSFANRNRPADNDQFPTNERKQNLVSGRTPFDYSSTKSRMSASPVPTTTQNGTFSPTTPPTYKLSHTTSLQSSNSSNAHTVHNSSSHNSTTFSLLSTPPMPHDTLAPSSATSQLSRTSLSGYSTSYATSTQSSLTLHNASSFSSSTYQSSSHESELSTSTSRLFTPVTSAASFVSAARSHGYGTPSSLSSPPVSAFTIPTQYSSQHNSSPTFSPYSSMSSPVAIAASTKSAVSSSVACVTGAYPTFPSATAARASRRDQTPKNSCANARRMSRDPSPRDPFNTKLVRSQGSPSSPVASPSRSRSSSASLRTCQVNLGQAPSKFVSSTNTVLRDTICLPGLLFSRRQLRLSPRLPVTTILFTLTL
eukprot:GHVQ01024918.1.p1 GENE.GHVQ01024918.1~~GHVQ01024918.1.p1  ORF type:complete len:942 (-),score=131.80 GHVQ01024918.1:462-3176(-)